MLVARIIFYWRNINIILTMTAGLVDHLTTVVRANGGAILQSASRSGVERGLMISSNEIGSDSSTRSFPTITDAGLDELRKRIGVQDFRLGGAMVLRGYTGQHSPLRSRHRRRQSTFL